jgi:hypothetical protein
MPGTSRGAWCHFNFDVRGAPRWLADLTARARMPKSDVSVSFLLAAQGDAAPSGGVRAVSQPFAVPGGAGVYGCSDRGLTLLTASRATGLPRPGRLVATAWPDEERRDAKSGAAILPMPASAGAARGASDDVRGR